MKIQDLSVAILGGHRMVNYDEALAAIEQARREAFEEAAQTSVAELWKLLTTDTADRIACQVATAIRSRGEGK